MCWYHPDTDRLVLCYKALWAAEFGVDRRRMDHWEKRLGAEDLERIRRGVIPLPARAPGPQGGIVHCRTMRVRVSESESESGV